VAICVKIDNYFQSNVCVVTGCSDEYIRGYRFKNATHDNSMGVEIHDENEILEYYGCVLRTSNSDKCTGLYFNVNGALLAAQSSGKLVDIYQVKSFTEANKKVKRRLKRIREKSNILADGEEIADDNMLISAPDVNLSDEIDLLHSIRCGARVRGFAFNPQLPSLSDNEKYGEVKAMIGLITNSIELYAIPLIDHKKVKDATGEFVPRKLNVIDIHGHRFYFFIFILHCVNFLF
jgi:hypothetical protein